MELGFDPTTLAFSLILFSAITRAIYNALIKAEFSKAGTTLLKQPLPSATPKHKRSNKSRKQQKLELRQRGCLIQNVV